MSSKISVILSSVNDIGNSDPFLCSDLVECPVVFFGEAGRVGRQGRPSGEAGRGVRQGRESPEGGGLYWGSETYRSLNG